MRLNPKYRSGLLLFVVGLATSAQTQTQPQTPTVSTAAPVTHPRPNFVGDDACRACHGTRVETFHQTAHYLTSRLPSTDSIFGNFTPSANVLNTSNPDLFFRMEQKGDRFFQTAVEGIAPYTESRTERFGLVIGSGDKGQTYLYWRGDWLFQLPVSYWKELGWVNSPGYRDGVANFERPVIPRCLECHATYFESVPSSANRYSQVFVVASHVKNVTGRGANMFIKKTSNILRLRLPPYSIRTDFLATGRWASAPGAMQATAPQLSPASRICQANRSGNISSFRGPIQKAQVDVHGDQVDLLKRSRCFQSSTMTCLTCHDVHTPQHDLPAFLQRCLSCHKPGTDAFPRTGHQATSNCLDCHMPEQDTNLIVFDWKGHKKRPQVRTHWIKTYSNTTTQSSLEAK